MEKILSNKVVEGLKHLYDADVDVNDMDPELDGLDINNEDDVSLEEK